MIKGMKKLKKLDIYKLNSSRLATHIVDLPSKIFFRQYIFVVHIKTNSKNHETRYEDHPGAEKKFFSDDPTQKINLYKETILARIQ